MSDYAITFAPTLDRPPETMVGETVYDSEGNAIGWIVNAKAGVGTCHVVAVKKLGDSFGFLLSCGHSMVNPFDDRPDYCPWCGKRVIEEVTE